MDFYLFLSSLDSARFHQSNGVSDFTVELSPSCNLKGQWECALVDFQLTGATIPFDPFCLCTDICVDSCVGDEQLPILRRLSLKRTEQDSAIRIDHPQYIRVKLVQLNRVRIFISNRHHTDASVAGGELLCTLHLRRTR